MISLYVINIGSLEMQQINNDLTQGNVLRQMIRYCVPLVVSSLLQSAYSIVDIMLAGWFVGDSGVSAINNVSATMNMITKIAIGLTIGGNILIGQYFGKKEHESCKQASGTLFSLCIIIGVIAAAAFLVFARPFLVMMKAPAFEEALAYFSICAVGIFFIFGYNAMSAILRGVGNSRIPLYCVTATVILNILLDALLMGVFDMGVRGAAIATVAAQMISFVTALVFSLRHRDALGLRWKYLRPTADMIKGTLRVGLPTALQYTIASFSWLTVMYLINKHGIEVSSGNGVSNVIRDFCLLFISAMTGAAGTMCAQCLGAQMHDRAVEIMKTCLKITLAMSFVIVTLAIVFAPQLCSLFSLSPEAHEWAVLNLRLEIVGQIFYAIMFSYNTLATGSGHTIFIMLNSFLNCIVVRLILAIILERQFGVVGVYVACGLAVASSAPVSYWFYRSGRWKVFVVEKSQGNHGNNGRRWQRQTK